MIVDSHAHFADRSVLVYDRSLEHCLETMDRLGIDCMIQSLSKALLGRPDFEGHIEECDALFEKSGGRVYSYFAFNPFMVDFCTKLIEDNYKDPAFVSTGNNHIK